jgi:hypothetical protein
MTIPLKIIPIKLLLGVLVCLFPRVIIAQTVLSKELDYVNYLIKNNQMRDALFFLKEIDSSSFAVAEKDSLSYYYGMTYHFLKKVDTAAFFLGKVSNASPFYTKSRFFSSLNHIYAGKLDEAKRDILHLKVDTLLKQQKDLQLCGIAILKRDHSAADSLIATFDYSSYLNSEEQTSLQRMNEAAKKVSRKKAYKAALLSTIVPGLGKYYAGRRGQAVATFFSTLGLALIAGENLYRGGLKSPQFIVTGFVFSTFYIGNIVGSAYSVRMVKKRNRELLDYEVKSSVHKAVRRIFN